MTKLLPHLEMWVESESLRRCSTLHQQRCSLTVSRGPYLVVLASFVDFVTTADQIKALDFRLGRLIEMWELIKVVTHVAFDATNCSVELQRCRAYTTELWLSFKDFMCNVFACLLKWVCLVRCEKSISVHSCFWLSQSLGRTCDGQEHTAEWKILIPILKKRII